MNRQAHDASLKHQARTVYQAHGAKRASEVTGVPLRTIRYWAKRDGWQPPGATGKPADLRVASVADTISAPAKGSVAASSYQPARLLERVTGELWAQLDELARLREAGRARDAREVSVTVGILLDKCAALAKQAGADRGQLDPAAAVARLDSLLDVFEGRASG